MGIRPIAKLILLSVFLTACDATGVYDQYEHLSQGWGLKDTVSFEFEQPKETEVYDLFVNVRNDNSYSFSNLFLVIEMNFPEGKAVTDTIEYEMAKANGEWLGKGFTDVKESKLWYKQGVRFPEEGMYTVSIAHLMRKNGEVAAEDPLKGIIDVGFRIEKGGSSE